MSENTKIEWADHTFNPWIGCTKVSPGCVNCYAETSDKRHMIERVDHWGKGAPRYRTSAANWKKVERWNRTAICTACGYAELLGSDDCRNCGRNFSDANRRRQRVFCASQADWLDAEVPIEWLADLLALIHATPNLDWLLLTKRPENFETRLQAVLRHNEDEGGSHLEHAWILNWLCDDEELPPANVWIGTSVEDQPRADERIPELLSIPARVRFLSCEPLLGPVDLEENLDDVLDGGYVLGSAPIHWVIIGGESGPNARTCNIDWIRDLVSQCQAVGVPAFVKQLGAVPLHTLLDISGAVGMPKNVTERALIHHPKGGDPAEWPEELRVREFPESPRVALRKAVR